METAAQSEASTWFYAANTQWGCWVNQQNHSAIVDRCWHHFDIHITIPPFPHQHLYKVQVQ